MANETDMPQGKQRIAGQNVPNWKGADSEDLEYIYQVNMQKSNHQTPDSMKAQPGQCPKCRNPLNKCVCHG